MRLFGIRLFSYVYCYLVNRNPRLRLFLINLFFPDRDLDIELYGSRLRVNARREVGYLRAYKVAQGSVAFRDEGGVLATLALLLGPTDTFVDIGANVGLFSAVVARAETIFPGMKSYALEPNPDTVRRLGENLQGKNVEIHNCALSLRTAEGQCVQF
jgi:hypothetical protein